MRPLTPSELLDVWERGLARPPAERALLLLAAGHPEAAPGELAALSVGRRDARLLGLRERTFGGRLVCLVDCPGCGERLELDLDVSDVRAAPSDDAPAPELSLSAGEFEARFRLPDSRDVTAAAECPDAAVARRVLLSRCLLAAREAGAETTLESLPPEFVEALVEEMGRADPQADVRLNHSCPACGREWQTVFDIVSFFWSELNAWAYRVLREVHTLASAYGWREADILAMHPWRRQVYLEMVG